MFKWSWPTPIEVFQELEDEVGPTDAARMKMVSYSDCFGEILIDGKSVYSFGDGELDPDDCEWFRHCVLSALAEPSRVVDADGIADVVPESSPETVGLVPTE